MAERSDSEGRSKAKAMEAAGPGSAPTNPAAQAIIPPNTGVLGQLFHRPKTEYIGKVGEDIVLYPKPSDLIFIRKCEKCKFIVKTRAAKCIVDSSTGVCIELEAPLMAGTLELIDCQDTRLKVDPKEPLPTISAERCKELHLYLYKPSAMGAIYTIECQGMVIHFQPPHVEENEVTLPNDKFQHVTKYKGDKLTTVLVIREAGGYATTEQELKESEEREMEGKFIQALSSSLKCGSINTVKKLFEAYLRSLLSFKPKNNKQAERDESNDGDDPGDGGGDSCDSDDRPFSSNIKDEEEKKEFFDSEADLSIKMDKVAEWVKTSKHVIVFTGAGISTSSGIPDYRSGMDTILTTGPGVWELAAHETERPKGAAVTPIINALPSPTHMAILQLQKEQIVKYIVSQNIDGLHRRSGLPPSHLAELHGNTNLETCKKCKRQYLRDFETREAKLVFDHTTSRICSDPACKGGLRDSIINFGEALPEEELVSAFREGDKADLCIVLGSSLRVQPASSIPHRVHEAGNRVVICNLQKIPTYSPDEKTMQVFAKCDDFMEGLCQRLGVPIPPFVLHRRARVSVSREEGGGALRVAITGLDIVEDLSYSFIKVASAQCGEELLEARKEPLTLTFPGEDVPLPSITIQCQSHYGEPTFQLECPPVGGAVVYRMAYEVLARKDWIVTKE